MLKDLSARFPYGVIVERLYIPENNGFSCEMSCQVIELLKNDNWSIKPYLRPMSSMTEEEKNELSKILNYEFYVDDDFALAAEDDRHRIRLDLLESYIDWLLAHHFDYRGLIPLGLALPATEGMYN